MRNLAKSHSTWFAIWRVTETYLTIAISSVRDAEMRSEGPLANVVLDYDIKLNGSWWVMDNFGGLC